MKWAGEPKEIAPSYVFLAADDSSYTSGQVLHPYGGVIGLGLLSVPVLAASASYALCETFHFRKSLDLKFFQASKFYLIIIAIITLGLMLNFIWPNPVKALIYSAVLNGIVATPLIILIALIGNNKKIMGKYRSGLLSNFFVSLTGIAMAISVLALFLLKTIK